MTNISRLRTLLAVICLGFSVAACGYNTIPTLEEQAKAKWGDVQNNYQRRADLIPNLVATVQGYAKQEKDVLTSVVEARAKATQVKIDVSQLTDPEKLKQFQDAQNQLSGALGRLLAVSENSPVALLWGIGGTPEGVISAAAIKCMGGGFVGRLWPRDEDERRRTIEAGYDLDRQLDQDELVKGDDAFFSATGVTDGDFLQGVRYPSARAATTDSMVMRSRTRTIRRIQARHDRQKMRALQIATYG